MTILKEVSVSARTVIDLEGDVIELTETQGLIKKNDKWFLVEITPKFI